MSNNNRVPGFPTLSEKLKLTKLCRKSEASYGSVHNLNRLSKIPIRKVKLFLEGKSAYT